MRSPWRSFPGCPQLTYARSQRDSRDGQRLVAWLCLVLLVLGCWTSTVQAAGETLEIRNTSPIAQAYGVPAMRGGRAAGLQARFTVDVANSFTGDIAPSEFVFLDGETAVFSYTVRRGFAERWEAGIEVPWVVHSGGRFDRFIDGFHDLFGLPDGGRPLADRGELDYVVRADGQTAIDIRSKSSDLGDTRGWIGWSLQQTAQRSLVLRAHAKFPTGRAKNLSGSGAFDGALSLDFVQRAELGSMAVQLSLNGGLTVLGGGDLLPDRQKTYIPFGHLGVAFGERFRVLGQLDAHGKLFNAELSHLGKPVLQGTLGVQYSLTPKLAVDLSLVEDLSGALAADAIFKLGLVGQL